MYFTTMNTFHEIMDYPGMKKWMRFLFLEDKLDYFKEEYQDVPLRIAAFLQHTDWGDDLRLMSDQLVDTANLILEIMSGERRCLHLGDWQDWEPKADTKSEDPDCVFLITPKRSAASMEEESINPDRKSPNNNPGTASPEKQPAVLIVPGGAYVCVSFQNEGTPISMLMDQNGYRSFTLKYRIAPHAAYPNPQLDLLKSVQYMREHSDEYGLDPDRIAVIGFSAGGHLTASSAGTAKDLCPAGKPNAVVLGYPVITLRKEDTHKESAENVTGFDDTLRAPLSAENLVTPEYPPTFLWTCEDDDCVPPVNSIYMKEALTQNNVKHEFHLYPQGGHGCGLAYGNSAHEWSGEMLRFLSESFSTILVEPAKSDKIN